ncbi:histidine phosphatase superfamily [Hypomontagnella monticulosa]|nr:histidine phosphatase superfamily [Hypomontagnella monticulosa]
MKFFQVLLLATAASAMVMPRHHAGQPANGGNAVGQNNNNGNNAKNNANNANANGNNANANANANNAAANANANAGNANNAANNANGAACNNNNKRHHAGQPANGKGKGNANNANNAAAATNANSLTSHGVEQANDLAAYLLEVDPPIEQVYSSPYYRCLQTIQPFVRDLRRSQTRSSGDVSENLPKIRVDLGLSEWYGLAHFEHPSSAPLDKLRGFFPEIDTHYVPTPAPSSRGESLPQLHERVARVIDSIIKRSDQEGHKAIVLCTHAAVVIALGRVLTGDSEKDFGAFTCGLSRYRRRGSGGIQAPLSADGKTGTGSTVPAARTKAQIEEARSKGSREIDHAGHVDPHPHDSVWSDVGSLGKGGTGLYGGWVCELDSECSFLRDGEERGWKFSGDESFIETDDSGLWSPNEDSRSSPISNETGVDSRNSHSNPANGTSKL